MQKLKKIKSWNLKRGFKKEELEREREIVAFNLTMA